MAAIVNHFIDFFGFLTGTTNRRCDNFEDSLRTQPDLWKRAFIENNITLCPMSVSMGDELTRENLMSHILVPHGKPGEYRTLRNEQVYITGNEVICGMGFPEARNIKVFHQSAIITNLDVDSSPPGTRSIVYDRLMWELCYCV